MPSDSNTSGRLLVAAIIVLSSALLGVGGYVAVLTARSDEPASGRPAHAPSEKVESIMRSIAGLGADQRWAEARAVARAAVERYPADQRLRLRYAELLQQAGEHRPAYEQYREALRIGPREAATEYLAGLAATRAGDREAALGHFQSAHDAKPSVPEYALHLGLTQFNLERFEAARASLFLAARADPDNAVAWGMLAQIALRSGNREMAREYIARARELDPVSTVWRIVEADALIHADPNRAADLLSRIEPADLPRPYGLRVAKMVFGVTDRHAEAARYFAHVSDADPDNAALALETADLFERAGLVAQARIYARRALNAGETAARRMLERLDRE